MDLDGTLLDSRDRVSEKNRTAIERAAAMGVIPVVASGRMRCEADFVLKDLPPIRYFIGMNGCLVQDLATGESLQRHLLPAEAAGELIHRLDRAGLFFQIYAGERVYCTPHSLQNLRQSGMSAHYLDMFGDRVARWNPENAAPVYKLLVVAGDLQKQELLQAMVSAHGDIQTLSSMPALGYYEVLPRQVDKAHAVAFLCDALAVDAAQVLAVGDSQNDRGMLRFAGKSAVVRNGDPRLQSLCDYIAPSNDADGVAAAIDRFIPRPDGRQ